MSQLKIGDRVHVENDGIGHIEELMDDMFVVVRHLTPRNVPSACSSICYRSLVTKVGENAVPMPRSTSWWKESAEFCGAVRSALLEEGI